MARVFRGPSRDPTEQLMRGRYRLRDGKGTKELRSQANRSPLVGWILIAQRRVYPARGEARGATTGGGGQKGRGAERYLPSGVIHKNSIQGSCLTACLSFKPRTPIPTTYLRLSRPRQSAIQSWSDFEYSRSIRTHSSRRWEIDASCKGCWIRRRTATSILKEYMRATDWG